MSELLNKQEQMRKSGYIEAIRYMNNANAALQKTAKDGAFYADSKYVSSACGIAYRGALVAMDTFFALKGIPRLSKHKRATIDFYRMHLARLDQKMLRQLNSVYNALHIAGYYELECDARIIGAGFEHAYALIERIKPSEPLTEDDLKRPSLAARIGQMVAALF
jgi:hypothetical protein